MTKFMDVHRGVKGITGEDFLAAHRADQAVEGDEGVRFEHAWADPESGMVWCLSEGPSAEAIQRTHERAGHPADEIYPVSLML